MANLRLIKKRVLSIKNIGKMTKALEMVSASKVTKAQTQALNAKPYANAIYELVNNLATNIEYSEIPLLKIPKDINSCLYIVISTNRGLVGSLNTNLFKYLSSRLSERKGIKYKFASLGRKARNFCLLNGELIADFSNDLDFSSKINSIVRLINNGFLEKEFDEVFVVYPEFINALNQIPHIKKILPITKASLEEEKKLEHFEILGEIQVSKFQKTEYINYFLEPDRIQVLNYLLPFYLEVQIAEAFYEACASEHSARMVAMKNATESTKELSDNLTLEYNKERQSLITNEINDITLAQVSLNIK